jgi:DNA excision repair protein ERCC-5
LIKKSETDSSPQSSSSSSFLINSDDKRLDVKDDVIDSNLSLDIDETTAPGSDDEEEQLALIMSVQKELQGDLLDVTLSEDRATSGATLVSPPPLPPLLHTIPEIFDPSHLQTKDSNASIHESLESYSSLIINDSSHETGVSIQGRSTQGRLIPGSSSSSFSSSSPLHASIEQPQSISSETDVNLERERRKKDEAALDSIRAEEARLRLQSGTAARDSDGVTSAMKEEVMALLQLFGVPFIIAPMEAEAQCAALEAAGIVDAVITDDSDAFLFGAKNVFKNIFEDKKFVEVYRISDIEKELGLDRQDLIRAALLLGSDYTSGVKGVGIVNAAEILYAFPGDDGLETFKTWLHEPVDPDETKAKPSKTSLSLMSRTDRFKALHRTQRQTWEVGTGFPNRAVLAAYRNPTISAVDKKFVTWHAPNVEGLRLAAREKFGWPANKTDDLLLPVLQELTSTSKQKTIDSYMTTYSDNVHVAAIKSKRLKTAVKGLSKTTDLGIIALDDDDDIDIDILRVTGENDANDDAINDIDEIGTKIEKERTKFRLKKQPNIKVKTKTTTKKMKKKGKRLRRMIESSSEDVGEDGKDEEEETQETHTEKKTKF